MISADTYRTRDTLKNGVAVTIRAIRPDDKKRIAEAFKNLERESIYTRFFRFKGYLTDEELRSVTEVDFENVVALVVTIGEGEGETIIGAGRYALYDPSDVSRSAEIAFTVEEDYHGQGIASRLLTNLTHIAREKGVSQFEAEVLPENRPMLAVFARSGLTMRQSFGDGVIHVTLSLTEKTS
jgi:RimJ/RimL family protein N-acetyltransferase